MGTCIQFAGGCIDGLVVRDDSPDEAERDRTQMWLALTEGGQVGKSLWTGSPAAVSNLEAIAKGEAHGAGHRYTVAQRVVDEDGTLTIRLEYAGPTE